MQNAKNIKHHEEKKLESWKVPNICQLAIVFQTVWGVHTVYYVTYVSCPNSLWTSVKLFPLDVAVFYNVNINKHKVFAQPGKRNGTWIVGPVLG